MDLWLTLRTFAAFFLFAFGVGLIFRTDDLRIMAGSAIAAIGLTFLTRVGIALRQR